MRYRLLANRFFQVFLLRFVRQNWSSALARADLFLTTRGKDPTFTLPVIPRSGGFSLWLMRTGIVLALRAQGTATLTWWFFPWPWVVSLDVPSERCSAECSKANLLQIFGISMCRPLFCSLSCGLQLSWCCPLTFHSGTSPQAFWSPPVCA